MNMPLVKLSAIVIVWNGRTFLPDMLSSLCADLSDLQHEIIVVDNGSRDESIAFIRKKFPLVTIIENRENLGFARAVNIGIAHARGEYIFILNQDLRIRPGCTQALLKRMIEDPTIGLIGPKFVDFDGSVQLSVRGFPTCRHVWYRLFALDRLFAGSREFGGWRMTWFNHDSEMFVDQPMGAAMLISRRVVQEVGELDENFPLLFNDVDYCRRLQLAGYKRLYYPKGIIEHYVGGSTKQLPYRLILISHRSLFRYLRKHSSLRGLPIVWLTGFVLYLTILPKIIIRFLRRLLSAAAPSSLPE